MRLDPIQLEILNNKVTSIAEEAGFTVQRTGRTLYVKETADFGTALVNLEGRERHSVQDSLQNATKDCKNKYEKGKRSFEVLAVLARATLEQYLPSFKRARKELAEKLGEKT